MKKSILFMSLAAIMAMVSCQKELPKREEAEKADPVFTATIIASKTTVDTANGKVSWDGNEEITITDGADVSVIYEVSSVTDGKATFTKKAGESGMLGDGPYTAVYGEAPSKTQDFSTGAARLYMTATSATTSLAFDVACGLMKIALTKDGESIKSVAVSDGVNTYTASGAAIDISTGADFYIALPAGNYKKFAFENSEGKYSVKTAKAGKEIAVAVNSIQPISFSSLVFNTFLVHDAAELTAAISSAADGDKILLAEGTYKHTGIIGITKELTLEGGYSASPSAADIPDPKTVKAALDGDNTRRVLNINANDKTVKLSGITIQNGSNSGNAGGVNIYGGSHAVLEYVNIQNNSATAQGAGFVVSGTTTQAEFFNCIMSGNNATGIGANLIDVGAAVKIYQCVFSGNSANGGGAMYVLNNNASSLNLQIMNSEFSGNTSTGRGGAIYLRSNGEGTSGITMYVANSTFSGNSSNSYGSVIDLYGSATLTCGADIYSSTFTANSANNASYDGAITTETAGTTVRIYNSIISGNTTSGSNANFYQKAGTITTASTVNGGTASDYLASSATSKDGFLTKAYKVKTAATTAGMSAANLKSNYTAGDADFLNALGYDQWGNTREGSTVGACVETE